MKFLKWLGISLLSIIALLLIIALFLPSNFHVEQSIEIEKPISTVFQTAIDMNQRAKWDPWIEMDPEAEIKVQITPEIIGSGYTWKGEIIGEGKITIQEFIPNELIKSKIEFIAPQSMESDVIWNFKKTEKNTNITWAFEGSLSYPIEKWSGLFMDKFMGAQFEKGLSNFKELVESLPDMAGRTGEIKEVQFEGLYAVTIKEQCDMNKLSSKMIEMYPELMNYLKNNNTDISGSPFAIYHPCEDAGQTILECGLPINMKLAGEENISFIEIPASKTIMASHFGHYKTVRTTYEALQKYITENNIEIIGSPWEMYITDPMKEPDQSKWETKVYFPIK
ncbi:MAG: GyrI-like domain-containing protein [Bacteroidales bacterium]|nr:GyrI-like domain-containing protein [Bacteroidales bacterium]